MNLARRIRDLGTALRSQEGITVVELGVSMLVTAILLTLMVTWVSAVYAGDDLHRADDETMQDLRFAKSQLTRELRRASTLMTASSDSLTVWLDDDRDEVMDDGEVITWTITVGGELTRGNGVGPDQVQADNLVVASSSFGYDDADVASVENVSISLVASVPSRTGAADGVRSLVTEVHLRNT